ncbi:MAG TPA: ATPase, T2SS/T4P/T4SS family [Candidatus Manganitrophaceae bacterium]|nr:ATPase, T2SS/T4P/T4SS family [Candidatus Manganitrophaceae bacterium]
MIPFVKRISLGELLVKSGKVAQEVINQVSLEYRGKGKRLGEALIEKGVINEEDLAEHLAEQFHLSYYRLDHFRLDPAFFKKIPVELMYRYPFVPYGEKEGAIIILISDPTKMAAMDELELILKQKIIFGVSSRAALLEALKRSEGSGQVLQQIQADFRPVLITENEEGEEVLSIQKVSQGASPVVKLLDTLILNALHKRASDIHVEASESHVNMKYRIDGVLYPAMDPLDIKFHPALVSRIKVLAELDIAEKRTPQDGRFKMRLEGRKVDFRVSVLPSIFGEDIVIRILDKEYITADINELRLERLGFNQGDLRKFLKAIIEPYGMVLVTGPTGSGKTTTLYAAITEINNHEDKIITIEDPVEYQLGDVVQIPVNEKKGLTFARGLRSILRHDPDKIMVGEIRDAETAHIAIQSALTGHLVFTTVHANNAFDVIGRFVNMGIEPYNFVSSLNCILAQRLVRILCPHCKQKSVLPADLLEISGFDPAQYKETLFHVPKGCPECNGTGFKGRVAITEFLDLSDPIREMILERRPPSEIRRVALAEGMTTLRQAGLEKIFKGETTLKEINRVTFIQ